MQFVFSFAFFLSLFFVKIKTTEQCSIKRVVSWYKEGLQKNTRAYFFLKKKDIWILVSAKKQKEMRRRRGMYVCMLFWRI